MNRLAALISGLALLLGGCASQTELTSVALDREARGHYGRILVLSISGDQLVRKTVEDQIGATLARAGVTAVVAYPALPGELDSLGKQALRQQAEALVLAENAEAVLVASLIRDEVREEYVAPQINQVATPALHPGFGPYVGYHYDTVVTPGYFTSQREVFVQTSLFDVETGQAVWRAQSRTLNPVDLNDSVAEFSKVLVHRLQDDGMLPAH
ncbi:hypothetical protein [Marinobacter xestospongiae]|uniref:hypothetical protein n=1 Tax=Marinobacter xestospongiae TaxID=994319 RepID=UPI00200568E4|nr:hypothetical protein [Marinobacter xestospongiae]MCK7567242.1 hypothetical protein [Marinobacter xestospongiae]